MFDKYTPPFTVETEGTTISVEEEKGNLIYRRSSEDDTIEKILLQKGEFLINPIEPVNVPKTLSSFLLIEFQRSVMIAPYDRQTIHLKFPIEIGIFISRKEGEYELIDIVTFNENKYTLYGNPNRGLICKHWESQVYPSYPRPDILYEGDLELVISNETGNWMEISQAVFNAYGMKIYYGSDRISMKAQMKIINKNLAEIDFTTYPLSPGFHRSVELYTSRKILLNGTKSVMEFGL
jgi:hypothetical protein